MSFIDWNAAALPSEIQGQNTQNQQAAFNLQQQQRAVNALRGINVGDQGSVTAGINALAGLGMIDQAKAVTDLAQQRGINTSVLPAIQNAGQLAALKTEQALSQAQGQQAPPTQQTSDGQQPDLDGAHRQILQQGADAVNDLLSYDDPTLRAAAADIYRQKFQQMGIPQQNIDEVLGDLSTTGLQAHEKFLTAAAQGDTGVAHPTGYAASQALLNSDPIYRNAQGELTGPLADATTQGLLAKYGGIDLGPGFARDLEVTAPARAQAAAAAFTPTISETGARASAIGSGSVGSPPVAGARLTFDAQGQPDAWILPNGTTQAIQRTAQAGANITTAPAGGHVVTDAQGNPTGVAPTGGYAQTAGGLAAGVTGAQGGAAANVAAANNFETVGAGAVARKGNLDNLRQEAGEFTSGPQSPFWAHLGALAEEYNLPAPGPIPKGDAVAAQAAFTKMATTILGQQRAALGLPATDQSTSITQGATPNDTLTAKGIQRVTGILEGNEDYLNAGYQAWTQWKNSGHGYETFQQFLPQWNKMFNPRIFQAQYMTPAEAAKVKASIPNYDAQVKVAQRLGYLGGQ